MKWLWRSADDLLLPRGVLVPPVGAPVFTVQLEKGKLSEKSESDNIDESKSYQYTQIGRGQGGGLN